MPVVSAIEPEVHQYAIRAIAFHLPQFHPIPENDKWWGKGFTEWINVVSASRVPGSLPAPFACRPWFLRFASARSARSPGRIRRSYGIYGFCYYHYWFQGRQVLERPVNEILKNGEPDFPFCLCWANENWTRRWDGLNNEILLEQRYTAADDLAHIRALIPFFLDRRYIRVLDRPFFAIYQPQSFLTQRTADIWRREAERAGLKGLFLVRVESHDGPGDPRILVLIVLCNLSPSGPAGKLQIFRRKWWHRHKFGTGERVFRENHIFEYEAMVKRALSRADSAYPRIPCVCPGWDNSSRRKSGATIFINSTPERYERWLREIVNRQVARTACGWNLRHLSRVIGLRQRMERMGRGKSSRTGPKMGLRIP